MDTIKGNILIAEFMGERVSRSRVDNFNEDSGYILEFNPYPNKHLEPPFWINANCLQFHSSWDWLMPVVARCFEIYSLGISLSHIIEEQYSTVVSFIEWYTSNKK